MGSGRGSRWSDQRPRPDRPLSSVARRGVALGKKKAAGDDCPKVADAKSQVRLHELPERMGQGVVFNDGMKPRMPAPSLHKPI